MNKIDYITCIGLYYPTVIVMCVGDCNVYSDIIWESGDPIPSQSLLDAQIFIDLQNRKKAELSNICENTIMGGFNCAALGTLNMYQSSTLDQINMVGATIASQPNTIAPNGTSIYYKCAPVVNGIIGTLTYQLHTPLQYLEVFMSGVQFKMTQLGIYQVKETYINSCTTADQVLAVTWTSTP